MMWYLGVHLGSLVYIIILFILGNYRMEYWWEPLFVLLFAPFILLYIIIKLIKEEI